jgi:hypothetical protein
MGHPSDAAFCASVARRRACRLSRAAQLLAADAAEAS